MKDNRFAPSLIVIFAAITNVLAWGGLGHMTVAYIATNFVDLNTKTFFQSILNNKTNSYLAGVATWADSYRYTSAGRFSAPFHFVDAKDDPPTSCRVTYSRDCGAKGCSLSAMQNYTSRVLNPELPPIERYIAAKFIIHFVGDIHQPLHNENLDIGGNSIPVNFSGVVTNLHAVWDMNMPEKLVGGYTFADAERWATTLTTAINSGVYKAQAGNWTRGMTLSDPVSTSTEWAEEANAFVCTTVMPDGVVSVENQELNGDYYEACVPAIQVQIARAGYRLAAWLNLIAHASRTEL